MYIDIVSRGVHQFIDQDASFTGNWVIFGNRVLAFLVKSIPNHRVYRTTKKKVNLVFY